MTPRATYRLQFHRGFTFAHAEAIVPYLDRLGISHIYASPITTAVRGSTHGYDVTDPTRINPELGGEEGFRSLVTALRSRDMGIIIDIVPNHMGIANGENPWWTDVLTHGRDSPHARVFDIDWSHRIVLPLLGTPLPQALADGAIAIVRHDDRWWLTLYGDQRLPLRDEDQLVADQLPLPVLLDRQHYRLAWWRAANDQLSWRRFFTINELAGVRVEDSQVFEATHTLYLRLWREGLIDGVRVDHIDGLTDPAEYCRTLRARFDAEPRDTGPAWIVIEKILASGEPLARDWGVDGTSGYDFMAEVTALLHDPAGAEPLGRLWAEVSGRSPDFAPEELQARQELVSWQFASQLEVCVEAFRALARSTPQADGITPAMLRRAIERLLWVFPVYRTYGTGADAPDSDAAIREEVHARVVRFVPPGEQQVIDLILAWLAGDGGGDPALAAEAVRRFQQLSAPVAAKAVEDTAFYRYGRLLSCNDVGFSTEVMGLSIEAFHQSMIARARDRPRAMLATATHDHKRGEDARARLAVLSAMPEAWTEAVSRWEAIADRLADPINRGDRYMLFQALVGAWDDDPALADRIVAWQQKALREAKLRSSWEDPDISYEARAEALAKVLIGDHDFKSEIEQFQRLIGDSSLKNSLLQTLLRYTVPGVPDLYQGAELLDLSLVDPDNRRPVDFPRRAALLDVDTDPKLSLIQRLLAARRDHPQLFAHGSYQPASISGDRPPSTLAFSRRYQGTRLDCAVLLGAPQDHAITLVGQPPRSAAELFASGPVWFAVSADDTMQAGSAQ